MTKQEIRAQIIRLRDHYDSGQKSGSDKFICHKLQEIIEERNVKTVHTFLPMGSEVNIWPLIEYMLAKGIKVVSPKSLPKRKMQNLVLRSLNELEDGVFGTKHPASGLEYKLDYDLIIVPGLAFDGDFNRIGYGAGYYDFFLKTQVHALKVGICYPFQLINKVPVQPHDIQLDGVLTADLKLH